MSMYVGRGIIRQRQPKPYNRSLSDTRCSHAAKITLRSTFSATIEYPFHFSIRFISDARQLDKIRKLAWNGMEWK